MQRAGDKTHYVISKIRVLTYTWQSINYRKFYNTGSCNRFDFIRLFIVTEIVTRSFYRDFYPESTI